MFDIGWSELVVIAVVALIAIGPKELPGVLRMVGQWMGKARKMAGEFQGQFQEAMREAEMADLKKSFDEVKDVATGMSPGNLMTSLQKDVSDSLQIPAFDKPVDSQVEALIGETAMTETAMTETVTPEIVTPTTPAMPTPETFVEAEAHQAASEPLIITREAETRESLAAVPQDITPAAPDVLKDAKAS